MDMDLDEIKKLLVQIRATTSSLLAINVKANYLEYQKGLTKIRTLVEVLESATIIEEDEDIPEPEEEYANKSDHSRFSAENNSSTPKPESPDSQPRYPKVCPFCGKRTLVMFSSAPLVEGCTDRKCNNFVGPT